MGKLNVHKLLLMAGVVCLATVGLAETGEQGAPPAWMSSPYSDHLFYNRGPYNFAIRKLPKFAADMYGTGVGHAMAYEALVTGREKQLESRVFEQITKALKAPPTLPVDESTIQPTFAKRYGALEKVFDWAHLLHFQTLDVLTYRGWNDAQKEAELDRLWKFYSSQPFAITGLPMNMEVQDGQSYSGAFRKKYPKVNGLFWGYHWLQSSGYDMLYRTPMNSHAPQYEVVGDAYRQTELFKTDREFMPMMGELSPRFSARFPEIANSFDNLHMLHDNVNDILATPGLTLADQKRLINEAIWRVLQSTHVGEVSGDGLPNSLHDHRAVPGMPGMGWMKGTTDEAMYMAGMGWMNMEQCGHCSMNLPSGPVWGATVSANGWTMRVRCLLCARDMASETLGRAIIRAATEDPDQTLVLISDEEGNWTTSTPNVVFLEEMGEHPSCQKWSRAFTSVAAFRAFVAGNPEYANAKPLTLSEWQLLSEGKTPDTYERIDKPSPYGTRGGTN